MEEQMKNQWIFLLTVLLIAMLAACSSSRSDATDQGTDDAGQEIEAETVADGQIEIQDNINDQAGDAVSDSTGEDQAADTAPEELTPPVPWTPEARGYKVLRGIVHLHSLYSHDGCTSDQEGKPESFFQQCLKEMRDAACASAIDFMMQTDHPGNVKDQTFEDAVHYQPESGDILIKDDKERPFANKIPCSSQNPILRSYFFLGTEGSKQMPIGLSKTADSQNGWKSVDPVIFNVGYGDKVPLENAQAAIAVAHASGGFAFGVHTEEDNISIDRIKALPLDGMEMFNIHPMFLDALGKKFDSFLRIDSFMTKETDAPVSDLAFLLLFAPVENDPIKFDAVAPYIRIANVGATDIHRNVELPALCPDGIDQPGLCQNLSEQYPNLVMSFVTGGPAILSDGDRFDSYARGFRWMANRTLVKKDAQNEAEEIRQATGHGKSFLAFDLMGSPSGFDFFAWADGKVIEMGEEVKDAKDVNLYVHAPSVSAPPWGIKHVSDYSSAVIKTRLIQAKESGSTVVKEVEGQGAEFSVKADVKAAWRIEVWITPKHLAPALKGLEDIASMDYPYIYSNAVFVR
jgi:hypothetical protein